MKKLLLALLFVVISMGTVQAAPTLGLFDVGMDQPKLGPRGNFAAPACTYVDAKVLAAGVAESVTVPTNAKVVIFSGNADFYVNWTTTAAVPVADIANGSGGELNPGVRVISNNIASFSIISPGTTVVTMSWYK